MEDMGQDKRLFKRVKIGLLSLIEVIDSPDDSVFITSKSTVQNISKGGVLIMSEEPYSIGTLLKLQPQVELERIPVPLVGRVVRIEEIVPDESYEIGVMFINLNEKQSEVVELIMDKGDDAE